MPDAKGTYGLKFTSADGGDLYLAFKAPKALYDSIVGTLGLDALTTPAQLSKTVIVAASNYCRRVGITYEKAVGDNRSGSLWCAPSKFEDVIADPPATYRAFKVIKAFQPLDTNRS